jgi:hypothetical protein
LCDCLDETLKYDYSVITNFYISFDEKNDRDNKFRKDRIKKVYRILDDNIMKMKERYPLFFSTQKEYDIYSLFPHFDYGKYDSFVDVFFRTGNFYFFLNLPNNLLNILNLPVYASYQSIQKRNSQKIHDYIFFVLAVDIKEKYNHCKKELNRFFLKYEQDTTND